MRRIIVTAAIATLPILGVMAGGLVAANPAFASGNDQICTINTNFLGYLPGECINAWNGGPYGKSYSDNVSNNLTSIQPIDGRCEPGSDLTTDNCPYQGAPANYEIYQLRYQNGQCYGTDTTQGSNEYGGAVLTGCNTPSTGYGGGIGTVQVMTPQGQTDCIGWTDTNSYWTNQDGELRGMQINASNGSIVYMNGIAPAAVYDWTPYPYPNDIGTSC